MSHRSGVTSVNTINRFDALAFPLIGCLAAAIVLYVSWRLSPFVTLNGCINYWFDTDCSRYEVQMAYKLGFVDRAAMHPLFATLTYPPTKLLRLVGLPVNLSVRISLAIASAIFIMLLYYLLRRMHIIILHSILLIVLVLTSASFICLYTVPETYPFASLTVLLGILVLFGGSWATMSSDNLRHTIAGAILLSVTVTNWAASFIAGLLRLRRRDLFISSMASLGLIAALVAMESIVSPRIQGPFIGVLSEKRFVKSVAEDSRVVRPIILLLNAVVMPSSVEKKAFYINNLGVTEYGTSYEHVDFTSMGWVGWAALVLWCLFLIVGLYAMICNAIRGNIFDRFIIGSLGVQILIFLIYGRETFLYTPLVLPWIILVAGAGVRYCDSRAATVLLFVLVIVNAANTAINFSKAEKILHEVCELRQMDYAKVRGNQAEPKTGND